MTKLSLAIAAALVGTGSAYHNQFVQFSSDYIGGSTCGQLKDGMRAWPDLFESTLTGVNDHVEGMVTTYPTSVMPAGSEAQLTCPEGMGDACDVIVLAHNCPGCENGPGGDLGVLLMEGWVPVPCMPRLLTKEDGKEHPMRGFHQVVKAGESVTVRFADDTGLVAFAVAGVDRACAEYTTEGCRAEFCPTFKGPEVPKDKDTKACSAVCPADELALRSCTETSRDVQVAVHLSSTVDIKTLIGGQRRQCRVNVELLEQLSAPLSEAERVAHVMVNLQESRKRIVLRVPGTSEKYVLWYRHMVNYYGRAKFNTGELQNSVVFKTRVRQALPEETAQNVDGALDLTVHSSGTTVDLLVSEDAYSTTVRPTDIKPDSPVISKVIAESSVQGGDLQGYFVHEVHFNTSEFVTSVVASSKVSVEGMVYPRCWGAPLHPAPTTLVTEECLLTLE